jgi:hypothetical protein
MLTLGVETGKRRVRGGQGTMGPVRLGYFRVAEPPVIDRVAPTGLTGTPVWDTPSPPFFSYH